MVDQQKFTLNQMAGKLVSAPVAERKHQPRCERL